jgi:hypothetical protein
MRVVGVRCGAQDVSLTVSLSHCVSLTASLSPPLPHRLSLTASLPPCLPHCVSLTDTPSLCLPHRVSPTASDAGGGGAVRCAKTYDPEAAAAPGTPGGHLPLDRRARKMWVDAELAAAVQVSHLGF